MKGAILSGLYVVFALGTFGPAAHSYQESAWARYSACLAVSIDSQTIVEPCRAPWTIEAPIVGVVSAALWPLWWGWTVTDAVNS